MAAPKIRIIFHEENNNPTSYFHLEKSESLRTIKILKILPQLTKWTPVSTISKMIGAKTPATMSTLLKLAGAQRIDIKTPEGRQIIAERPILLIKKEQHNTRNNLERTKYLRPTAFAKTISKTGAPA